MMMGFLMIAMELFLLANMSSSFAINSIQSKSIGAISKSSGWHDSSIKAENDRAEAACASGYATTDVSSERLEKMADIADDISNYVKSNDAADLKEAEKMNQHFIRGLLDTIQEELDTWMINGSLITKTRIYSTLKQVERQSMDPELVILASRMIRNAGLPLEDPELSEKVDRSIVGSRIPGRGESETSSNDIEEAATFASNVIARSGSETSFMGARLGIGGLDEILLEIKRRVWIPLAAPPSLLQELGIQPVRGLLLFGQPGTGKTLLARSLSKILSPMRPPTIVSGPEIMDRFVGSSEANLRKIFDSPPDLYPQYATRDDAHVLKNVALHVIILDEFDAMARARGRSGQGDAGVARDSVVNQLLAKMDGVDELKAPTLVVGLTNKRDLIEPALLRSGRFEVQVEVPMPKTVQQRVSILKVHMDQMYKSGRLLVQDVADGTPAKRRIQQFPSEQLARYDELLNSLAEQSTGMSGASLAGVCRSAASRALERSVSNFAGSFSDEGEVASSTEMKDCLVRKDDFEQSIQEMIIMQNFNKKEDDKVSEDD